MSSTRATPVTAMALALAALTFLACGRARADELRDPMRPPQPAQRSTPLREAIPVLSGIVSADGRRSAILDGHVVHAGSVLGPFTIDAVLENGVRYHDTHGVRELHLAPASSIKKPSA